MEEKIALYMKNLDLTREEAIELIRDEQEDNLPDLTAEQKAVVKEMTQAERKKETVIYGTWYPKKGVTSISTASASANTRKITKRRITSCNSYVKKR